MKTLKCCRTYGLKYLEYSLLLVEWCKVPKWGPVIVNHGSVILLLPLHVCLQHDSAKSTDWHMLEFYACCRGNARWKDNKHLPNTSSKQFTSRVSTCLWVAGLSLVNKGRRSLRLKSAVTGPDRPYNTLPWPWKVWKPRILFVIVRQFYVDWEWLATLSWCKILPQMVGDFSFCT